MLFRSETGVKSEWIRRPEQNNFPKITVNTPLSLTIKALDTVWLKVTCDGKVLYESTMRRGMSDTWTAAGQIEIWTGNSSNMNLVLNRVNLGSPGKGVVKKMLVSREGVKILSK